MDSSDTIPASDRLAQFCRAFLSGNRDGWPAEEHKLATDFMQFFELKFIARESLTKLCEELNIQFSEASLPEPIRGYNDLWNGIRRIIISTHQLVALASFEHTVLHELREQIEYVFRELGASTAKDKDDLEKRAEQFAAVTRMGSALNLLEPFADDARHIEARWKRYLAYAGLGLAFVIFVGQSVFLPHWEDVLSVERKHT